MTTTDAPADLLPWQAAILDQLEEIAKAEILDDTAIATRPFLIVGFNRDETVNLLGRYETLEAAENEISLAGDALGRYEHVRIEELAAIGFDMPVVDDDPDPADTTDAPTTPVEKPEDQLFDASDYDREDLAIPKVDGNQIDKIRFSFSGSVMLDRSAIADVALFNGAKLGQELELRVAATVSKIGTGFTTNRDGDLDVIVGEKTLKIDSVYVLDPEEL